MDCVDAVTEEIVEGMEKEADEEEGPYTTSTFGLR
jgi:hypothetical protein